MAIQKSMVSDSLGIEAPNAYIRIISFHGNTSSIAFDVVVYFDRATRDNGKGGIDSLRYQFPFDPNMTLNNIANPLVWAYDQLKTQPEFAGAIDV